MIRAVFLATLGAGAALLLFPIDAHAREVACAPGAKLKAKNGNTKSTITFTNRTPDKQVVYWIDYDGKRHKYQELEPGESYDQPTFLTHPWLVTGLRDACVGYYLAEGKKTSVEPGIAPIIKPINQPKKKKKVAALPKREQTVTVRKPAAKIRVPAISDDDFEEDDFAKDDAATDRDIVRKRDDLKNRRDDSADYDYENDEDSLGDEDTSVKRDDDFDEDDRDDENDVAIAEPLPRVGDTGRSLSPEWGDEPLNTGRTGISRNWRCTEYNSRTEAAICNSTRLSRLDDELERLYSSLLQQLPRRQRTRVRRNQQRWLENRESCGRRIECIARRTERRMARLNRRMERSISRRSRSTRGFRELCPDGGIMAPGGHCLPRRSSTRGTICAPGYRHNAAGRCVRNDRSRARAGRGLPSTGQSLGGRVRDIPALDGRRVASLPEGTPVTILERTGERHRGYEWFKIRFGARTGYTWGGILCTDQRVSGVFNICR